MHVCIQNACKTREGMEIVLQVSPEERERIICSTEHARSARCAICNLIDIHTTSGMA